MTVTRDLSSMFPGYFQTSTKRDHYIDFGFPKNLTFQHFYQMYRRNGFAKAAVNKTVGKTWQSNPYIQENDNAEDVTPLEKLIVKRFEKIRFWQVLAEADRRSLVGKYAGVIFRFADGKRFNEPVDRITSGLDGQTENVHVRRIVRFRFESDAPI
jgi:uncharacterized protein